MNKKWLLLALGILVVLAGVWFFWFRHYQDKQKFERIEFATEELAIRIANEFNTEVESTIRYCSKEARKLESEPLNCHVSKLFSVNNPPNDEVLRFVAEQKDLIEPTSVSYIFKLIGEDASCDINNPNSNNVVTNNFNVECSKRATTTHYELVE